MRRLHKPDGRGVSVDLFLEVSPFRSSELKPFDRNVDIEMGLRQVIRDTHLALLSRREADREAAHLKST
jgi:hypothetical protein